MHCTNFLSGRAIGHMMACIVHISVRTDIAACFCISLWCLRSSLSVLRWKSIRMCGRLLAPLSGITLTTRAFRTSHHTLSNSYILVRAPRLPVQTLASTRESYGPASSSSVSYRKSHTVPSVHRFRWTPPALSQVTFCQLRLLRLPRSSPLLHSWSVASLFTLPRRPSYQSSPHLWMPLRSLFHTSLSLRTFLPNSRSRSSSTFYARCSLPHVFSTSPFVTS